MKYLLIAGDMVILAGTGFTAAGMRNLLGGPEAVDVIAAAGITVISTIPIVYILLFYIFNLYNLEAARTPLRCLILVAVAIAVALCVIAALLFFMSPGSIVVGRTVLVSHATLVAGAAYVWRLGFLRWLVPQWAKCRVGILCSPAEHARLAAHLEVGDVPPLEIVHTFWSAAEVNGAPVPAGVGASEVSVVREGVVGDEPLVGSGFVVSDVPTTWDLRSAAYREHINVIVCSTRRDMSETLVRNAIALRNDGVAVCDYPSFYSGRFGKIPLDAIDGQWVLQAIRYRRTRTVERLRRLVDVVGATVLLLMCAPAMLVVALAIRVTSRGSIVFVQERLGLDERPFQCYKFRTMVHDAEGRSGPRWADETDARITPVGRLLRRTRLDELPQLLNVLKGEMSLVGFRPIRRHFADILQEVIPFYHLRFGIKPGLTGWPQVRHNYAGSLEGQREKFEYELFYLANRSLLLDCYIMIKTLQVVLFGRGQ